VFESAHVFFPELNPILSLLSFHQVTVAGFISNGGSDLSGDASGERQQTQIGVFSGRTFDRPTKAPPRTRGNAYIAPNAVNRLVNLGIFESFTCAPAGGERKDADDQLNNLNPLTKGSSKQPPCFVAPPSLYDGRQFPRLERNIADLKPPPRDNDGTSPAVLP